MDLEIKSQVVGLTGVHDVQNVGRRFSQAVCAAKYGPALTGLKYANSNEIPIGRRCDGKRDRIALHFFGVDPNSIGPQDFVAVFEPDLQFRSSTILPFGPRRKRKAEVSGGPRFDLLGQAPAFGEGAELKSGAFGPVDREQSCRQHPWNRAGNDEQDGEQIGL